MSVAFHIVLDQAEPGFDPFVNGKALARESERLEAICRELEIPSFEDFISMSAEDIRDMLDEGVDLPEEEEKWFSADEGIAFARALADYVRANPGSVGDQRAVLGELGEYVEVFRKAKGVAARWHLSLDI